MSKIIVLISFTLLFFSYHKTLKAQISESAVPYSLAYKLSSLEEFEELPKFYKQTMLEEDKAREARGFKAIRFAKMFEVAFHPYNSGQWDETGEGKVWRLGLYSEDAYSLYLVFKEFQLEEGVKLFVYNAELSGLAGAFTYRNNNKRNVLTIAPIAGEKLIIELDIPWGIENFGKLLLGRVGHDYKNEFGASKMKVLSATSSGSCNVDINCTDGENWQDDKRAVCKLVANGELCTGTLINNVDGEKLPYFLTAYHCMETEAIAEEATFIFNYESVTCGGTTYTTPQSLSGSELLATTDNKLDFSLLKLLEYPPLYYNPYFAGWDARGDQPSSAVCIHHPLGDVKKISMENHPLTTANYGEGFDAYSHWLVAHWESGTTEGGSSGSPIFNSQHRIVGTLTGGSATCADPTNDYFTKFSLAWDKYADTSNQLKRWLDPNDKGITFVNGIDPYDVELGVCDSFWNISKTEHIMLSNQGLSWGWVSGHNSKGFTQFAEKFLSESVIKVPGVFLYVAKNYYASSFSTITLRVWEGDSYPSTEIYSRSVYLKTLTSKAVNFIGFDTLLTVAGNFFVGYEISYSSPSDTFAVYHADNRGYLGPSTMYVNQDGTWKNIDAVTDPALYTSLSIGLVGCGGSITIPTAKEISVYPNPCTTLAQTELPEGITITGVLCYDITGRPVSLPYQHTDGMLYLYPQGLSSGMYMLKIGTRSKALIARFIVLKEE